MRAIHTKKGKPRPSESPCINSEALEIKKRHEYPGICTVVLNFVYRCDVHIVYGKACLTSRILDNSVLITSNI